jgi:hypothetical protein
MLQKPKCYMYNYVVIFQSWYIAVVLHPMTEHFQNVRLPFSQIPAFPSKTDNIQYTIQ